MKSKSKKIVTILLCITMLIGFIIPNYSTIVYATNTTENLTEGQKQDDAFSEKHDTAFGAIADGVVGLITWPLRALIVAFGEVIRLIIGGVAVLSGEQSIFDARIRSRADTI